jgi:RuvB-like protein 1
MSDETLKIQEVGSASGADKRVAAHSHIRGLGLNDDGTAQAVAAGFVGQVLAREVYSIIFK